METQTSNMPWPSLPSIIMSPFSSPTRAEQTNTQSPAVATAAHSAIFAAAISAEAAAIGACTTLSSPSLHVAPNKFFLLIQDGGRSWTDTKPNKYWVPEKSTDKIGYPIIYECGDLVFRLLQEAPALFPKLQKGQKGNATRQRKAIMKFIFEMRTSYPKAQINEIAFPGILECVSELPDQDLEEVFVLDQMHLLRRISTVFGGDNIEELQKSKANDRIRLFGIALSEDFLEDLRLLVDRKNV